MTGIKRLTDKQHPGTTRVTHADSHGPSFSLLTPRFAKRTHFRGRSLAPEDRDGSPLYRGMRLAAPPETRGPRCLL